MVGGGEPVVVSGRLEVGSWTDPQTGFVSQIRVVDATFGVAEPTLRRPPTLAVTDLVVERREGSQPARRLLDGVSFVVEPGAVVAITGPSGAGKTTLLHAVAGLVKPDAGTVSWETATSRRYRRRSAIAGAVTLWDWCFRISSSWRSSACLKNILLPARFDHWRTPRALVERAAMLANKVGLGHRGVARQRAVARRQQRVAIARALMRDPQLILADEPTASLDADNSVHVIDLLIEAAREMQTALSLSPRRPVARLCPPRASAPGRRAGGRSGHAAMNPWPVVIADLRALRWVAWVTPLLVAVAVAVGVAISAQEQALRQSSAQAADDFEPVDRRPGQPHAARVDERYLQPEALALIDGAILNALARDGRVRAAAPIAFGDSVLGHPVGRHDGGVRGTMGPPCAERRPALCPRGRSGRRCRRAVADRRSNNAVPWRAGGPPPASRERKR